MIDHSISVRTGSYIPQPAKWSSEDARVGIKPGHDPMGVKGGDRMQPEIKKIRQAFDCKLRRPACVLLQAVYGCDTLLVSHLFSTEKWLLAPTPDMALYEMTLAEWKEVALKINAEPNNEKKASNAR